MSKAKRIVDIAKQGSYQHACACFFEASHDIEDQELGSFKGPPTGTLIFAYTSCINFMTDHMKLRSSLLDFTFLKLDNSSVPCSLFSM